MMNQKHHIRNQAKYHIGKKAHEYEAVFAHALCSIYKQQKRLRITPSNWSKYFCIPQKHPPAKNIVFIPAPLCHYSSYRNNAAPVQRSYITPTTSSPALLSLPFYRVKTVHFFLLITDILIHPGFKQHKSCILSRLP